MNAGFAQLRKIPKFPEEKQTLRKHFVLIKKLSTYVFVIFMLDTKWRNCVVLKLS